MNDRLRLALMLALGLAAGPSAAEPLETAAAGAGASFSGANAGPRAALFEIPREAWLRLRAFRQAPEPIVVPLPYILDNTRRTSLTFLAGSTPVHIFGDMSDNGSHWFVGFAPDGAEAQFRPVMKMVQVLGMGGSADFSAGGRRYTAHVRANMAHKLKSALVVENADGGKVGEWSARQISEASYASGYPIKLGGRDYRVLYFRNFVENGNGQFGGYNGRRSIVLMTRDGDGFSAFNWYEGDIPRGRAVYSTPASTDADGDKVPGSLRLGLEIDEQGRLLIYPPN